MRIRNILLSSAITLSALTACQSSGDKTNADMDKFVDDLMGKMTIQEKIGQLNLPVTGDIVTGDAQSKNVIESIRNGEVGGLFNLKGADKIREVQRIAVEESRLGIPLIFGMDVIHGYETVFPIPLALSCSWDMEAIEKSARVAAYEATADGICWTFSPMVDICRDPRWGRMSEGNGEDPYLGSQIAKAMVRGYQGSDLADSATMMACVKHFALYGAAEAGRDYNTVDMSRQTMYNGYFPPYKAAAEAGAGSYMTSFNVVDGVPSTGNKWLMTDVLRNQWGFDGFVVTDYTAIYEMIAHGMGDLQEVSALALKAGTDMDMVSDGFIGTLKKSLEEGKVTEADINKACRRILEAKYKLGLFDDPYKYCDPEVAKERVYTDSNRAFSREVAAETFVLLKNDGNVLPLKKQGRVALIGPLADTRANMPGTWSVAAAFDRYKSLREGMTDALKGKAEVLYAKGCNLTYDATLEANMTLFGREMRDPRSPQVMLAEALAVASRADVIVFAGGEASEASGESSSRSDITLPQSQIDLLTALKKTGKPIVMLNFAGRSTVMNWESENLPAILQVWFGGSEAADAICDVLFGDKTPSGKLTTSFPRSVGQLPLYYNHLNTGRPNSKWFTKFTSNYLDVENSPLYPFGYGLSYTSFNYGDLVLSADNMTADDSVTATVSVTNTGDYDGAEVVQLYIRDMVGSVSRPVKELKDFKRVSIARGETVEVSFTIDASKLKFYNADIQYVCEPGEFQVMVGTDSEHVQTATLTLN